MKKITDFIVKFKYIFLIIFIVLGVFSLYLSNKVNINDDIMKYLPKDSETKLGNDIMEREFAKLSTSNLEVMFEGLSGKEKERTLTKLSKIKGVSSATYKDGGKYTLYNLTVDDYSDSVASKNVYDNVKENYKSVAMSGSIYDENRPLLQLWIVALSIGCALIILIILSESWFEPFLYLISIGIAVFINKGTNVMFDSVSSITNSIVAVLQLALSMDYSIMLSNRYKQEKKRNPDKQEAMKKALYQSFKAISSSSLTTIVGLIALVFMSFTIGKDLGFVLAKGVLLSLISIFFCLPGLLLLFDKVLEKTKKKAFKFKLNKLGGYCYKTRYIQVIFIVVLFVVVFLVKGSVNILYTDIQLDEVGKVFNSNNQMAIVYNNKNAEYMNNLSLKLREDEKVNSVLSYNILFEEKLSSNDFYKIINSVISIDGLDEDLVKFIFYIKFDGKIYENISLNDVISLVNKNNLLKSYISKYVDSSKLAAISTKVDLNAKLSSSEMASILGIDENIIKIAYIYYSSLDHYLDEWRLSGSELISFGKDKLSELSYITDMIPITEKAKLLSLSSKITNIKDLLISDDYSRIVLNTEYKSEGKETYNFIKGIKEDIKEIDDAYVVGISPMAYEMNSSFNSELNKITIITFILIFMVVAIAFRDFIIPLVLVLIIQCAVYLTMSFISVTGGSLYFLSILIVQAILMGATIDYAIVYTSYYKEARLRKGVKDAIVSAYKGSINTILSSASILIIVTLIVANFADAIAARICQTVSQGTLCALILVVAVLPGVLAASDKIICRKDYYIKEDKDK